MSDLFEILETHENDKEADFLYGWEALQDALAEDEEWALSLFEAFHGQEV